MFTPYNPAKDGFPAKAWECLRRNEAFYDDYSLSNAHCEEDAIDEAEHFKSHMQSHPFYNAVYAPLVQWSECHDSDDREQRYFLLRSLSLHESWHEIHSETKGYLEASLARLEAIEIETPEPIDIDPYSEDDFSETVAKKLLSELWENRSTHRPICIPSVVWDRRHKESILAEVSEILGKPLAKDARWLQNNGRVLGSEAEWRAFLLVEQWLKDECGSYGIGMAANLAAWEIYGGEDFGEKPNIRLKSGKAFRIRCSESHKQTSTIQKRAQKVMRAIKSVYPVFNPVPGAKQA